MKKENTGERLNREWGVNAEHALYNEVGLGFEKLSNFPGALFDKKGFVLFQTEEEYREFIEKGFLNEGVKLTAHRGGIKNFPGYRLSSEAMNKNFEQAVAEAQKASSKVRQARLAKMQQTPNRIEVSTFAFLRNADVVAEVLDRAGGICEECKTEAPFKKRVNGTPYLEVHHRIHLADGGDDTVENTIALCPNCHRKAHFG
jgi:hypothetical protein